MPSVILPIEVVILNNVLFRTENKKKYTRIMNYENLQKCPLIKEESVQRAPQTNPSDFLISHQDSKEVEISEEGQGELAKISADEAEESVPNQFCCQ